MNLLQCIENNANQIDTRSQYWKNIDIENNLIIHIFEYENKKIPILKDKRTNKKLQVILDPMISTTFSKVYPYGNWISPDCKDEERKKRPYDPVKLIDADYCIHLESDINDPCIKWLKKLEQWYAQECLKFGLWSEELESIKDAFNEEKNNNDNNGYKTKIDDDDTIIKRRFVKNLTSMIKNKRKYETKREEDIIENRVIINMRRKIYNTYQQKKTYYSAEEYITQLWDLTEKRFLMDIIEKNKQFHKTLIPLYDYTGKIIKQEDAQLKMNDEVVLKVEFKHRSFQEKYGLFMFPIWIQIVKEGKENNNDNDYTKLKNKSHNEGKIMYPIPKIILPNKKKKLTN